jgi:hypothetical protein
MLYFAWAELFFRFAATPPKNGSLSIEANALQRELSLRSKWNHGIW